MPLPMTIATRPFSSYRYSAFMSYAFDDDKSWNKWISNFGYELNQALKPRVRGFRVPDVHLASANGPIHGVLSDALRCNVEDSFAMLLFVHDAYVDSNWCLDELQYFKSLFASDGFRDRLYIIGMSEPAILNLKTHAAWKRLFPYDDQVWMPFFRDGDRTFPIPIYPADARPNRATVSEEFWERFVRLREQLAVQLKKCAESERDLGASPVPTTGGPAVYPSPEDRDLVRIYIEGTQEHKYWGALSQKVSDSWDQVVALEHVEPPLHLRPTGLPLSEIHQRPILGNANGVVLLWARKTPDTLLAQVRAVEPQLSGPKPVPGLVAYLMNSAGDLPSIREFDNWPVTRFLIRDDGSATVIDEDASLLKTFLKRVLSHKRSLLSA